MPLINGLVLGFIIHFQGFAGEYRIQILINNNSFEN
jgi:hypothetical protein